MHSFKQAVVLPWGIKKLKQPKSFDKMEEFVQKVRKQFAHFYSSNVLYWTMELQVLKNAFHLYNFFKITLGSRRNASGKRK